MDILSTPENARKVAKQKQLDDLVRALGGNSLPPREPCMEGTRIAILQEIENEVNKVDGHNVIWIRGFPGVGKSALAASIRSRLQRHRHVIWFRFDRTQSTTITTKVLWHVVACDLARWYPSFRQQLVRDNSEIGSSNIDRPFETLIEKPLSALHHDPHEQLPVIVVDALDECGGFRHDLSGQKDYDALLRTLQHWAQEDCRKKFRLIITSRPDERIERIYPKSISTHVNIPSGNDVKPDDSASKDIQAFLMSPLSEMDMDEAWVREACDYLAFRAAGMFIWATTAIQFLRKSPQKRLDILKIKEQERGSTIFGELDSLYSTIVKTSFRHNVPEEEIKAVTSVVGATIFAKRPLDDTVLTQLPGVDNLDMLKFVKDGLASVIDSGPTFRFHHRSFEDFLLSEPFRKEFPNLSDVRNRDLPERQLAALCLDCMVSSELHFNMCKLNSSSIKNVASDKPAISPLVSYASLFWADHLVWTEREDNSMKAVNFVMREKLLFWIEAMSILGKAHEVSAILKRVLEWPRLAVCPESISCNTTLRLTG